MKRFFGFLLLLCSFFGALGQGLGVGDKLPDGVLGEYRGKVLVLDFWATWCAPCRAMVPVMDSLQKEFGDNVVFLPVAYESAAVVGPVLAAMQRVRPFSLPGVVGDTVLGRLFPHRALPHFVWIGGDGVVRGITEEGAVTGENLRRVLAGDGPLGARKADVPALVYDAGRPLFFKGEAFRYHSLLTGFVPGLPGGLSVSAFDPVVGQHFSVRNAPLVWLARLAYGEGGRRFPSGRVLLASRDSLLLDTRLSGQAYGDWLAAGRGYCYELWLPPELAFSAYAFLREDMRRLFPAYAFSVEKRELPCLALVRVGKLDKLSPAGGEVSVEVGPYGAHLRNAHLSQLMMRLEGQYLQGSALPLADLSGMSGRVDLDISAPLSDVKRLNAALLPYGLALLERPAAVEVLVISDRISKP